MRVGVNATILGDRPTSIALFTAELCRCLVRDGVGPVVFASATIEGTPPAAWHKSPSATQGSPRLLNNLLRFLYLNTVLPSACRARHADVLFSPLMEFPFTRAVPQVVHVHDMHPLRFSSQFGLSSVHFRLAVRLLHRYARRVTVSSSFTRGDLLTFSKVPAEKIDIVPLAFDSARFVPRRTDARQEFCDRYGLRQPYILYVGNLFPYKNVRTLIQAFLDILDRTPHVLVIAGRRDLSKERLPLHERIRYVDYVPVDDLAAFYSFADLHVHPSLSEGFGLTPLEAMACGTPVISSKAASLPEVVGDAGILFDPHDTAGLSRLILDLLRDEPLRRELRERGFRRVRQFTWERTARGVLDSCRKALGRAA